MTISLILDFEEYLTVKNELSGRLGILSTLNAKEYDEHRQEHIKHLAAFLEKLETRRTTKQE